MNSTIETILRHRSIRKFKNDPITPEQIKTIVKCAQHASTSSYVMAYTIIGITDETIKEELTTISGHEHVKNSSHLFLFCADLNRIYHLASKEDQEKMKESIESTEQFLVATIDTALAAQNAVIAAESMGLGVCYIGGIRNNIKSVNDILELPDYVIPLFGLAVGYPAHQPEQKPRLPLNVIYHENTYDIKKQTSLIEQFDKDLEKYYIQRGENARTDTWSDQMIRKYTNPIRMDVTQFVKDKKLNKR
ncbi:oxygen-insensitive NADPH nitroreductase [Virgibacillus oceani]|uniref:FMN reductase (NADPH) n=1 Tax=Virgibacillus oceani TaxID=1479511 RepID=A0A917H8U9_9BACI|nr:oxygen-insensitive NADPH nitroreductase [Virgibacillus oceani]GGG70500.1 FMN reductase (NADPH) [Virgibacillus oceani]